MILFAGFDVDIFWGDFSAFIFKVVFNH